MKRFSSKTKLLTLVLILLLVGLSLANLFPRDCIPCNDGLEKILIEKYLIMDGPRPPCCPPDTTMLLTPTLRDTTMPVINGYRVRKFMTISQDSTLLVYQITIEKIIRGNFSAEYQKSKK